MPSAPDFVYFIEEGKRKRMRERFIDLWTALLRKLPGGELRRCRNLNHYDTKCIKHLNHLGKCEDAWRYKWHRDKSL